MPFLIESDYNQEIREEILDNVINQDESLIAKAELKAQATVESYLRNRYDLAHLFSQTGDNRDLVIVGYMVSIVVYRLHLRISYDQTPDTRREEYDNALLGLKMIAKGDITLETPLLPDQNANAGGIATKSKPKTNFDF